MIHAIKLIAGGVGLAVIWILAVLVSCVMAAIPLAIGLTIIALFGRAIGVF